MPPTEKQELIRSCLQAAIEEGSERSLTALFVEINNYANEWLNAARLLQMPREMSDLFSAASALISRELNHSKDPSTLLAALVGAMEESQRRNRNYGVVGIERLPEKRLHVTATGGERGYRTLYVTIAVGLICSHYVPTIVQGNYSVTGCGCGAFAESDMMEYMGYPLGSSTLDLSSLEKYGFAYLHVQRYHPILKVFSSERGSLGFRDMMKLAVVLADPFQCEFQFIGVWDKKFMEPMAKALQTRGCVKTGALVSSDKLDEFTTEAYVISSEGAPTVISAENINELIGYTQPLPGAEGCPLVSEPELADECSSLRSFFEEDIEHTTPKLKFVLHNAALALAVSSGNGFPDWQEVIKWKEKVANEWIAISENARRIMLSWNTFGMDDRYQ